MGGSSSKAKKEDKKKGKSNPKATDVDANNNNNADGANLDPGLFVVEQKSDHFEKNYKALRKLGDGAYGEVLEVLHKPTGAKRAVKVITKTGKSVDDDLIKEVEIVKRLAHPNVMKCFEFFEDTKRFYFVMEVYTGGELFDEIMKRERFTEADAADVMEQCLSGINYLHQQKIVHRDLKPENLLLSEPKDFTIKLVDFGLACKIQEGQFLKERYGTSYYIAPEVIKKHYTEKCDIWSLGVILYILLCGYPPFNGSDDSQILQCVEQGSYDFDEEDWAHITPEGKNLVQLMLTFDYNKRPSADECLKHVWLADKSMRGKMDHELGAKVLKNMKSFQTGCKLSKAAVLYIASKLTTMEETKELEIIFRSLDTDGNGQLDRAELIAGYNQLKGSAGTKTSAEIEAEVDSILNADFDGNGMIDINEFVAVAMNRDVLLSEDKMKQAFKMFDIDGDGSIDVTELRRLVGNISDAAWKVIISEVDKDGNGVVDYSEFKAMLGMAHFK